jgi:hypothetical protein
MSLGKFANYLWNRISKGQEWDWLSDPFWRVQTLAIFFVVGLVGLIFRMRPPGRQRGVGDRGSRRLALRFQIRRTCGRPAQPDSGARTSGAQADNHGA